MHTDPFTSISKCVQRLHKEYNKHPRLIIAVDFDDTVYDFHSQGAEHKRVINVLKQCKALNFYVVLWTASKPERFEFMRGYMQALGITVDAINENPIVLPFGNHNKIYYNILLDDRAGLGHSLETLEIFINDIERRQTPETSAESADVVNPIAASELMNCCEALRVQGLAYPRTCAACGLGPCKHQL
jgi:hypothetical protein